MSNPAGYQKICLKVSFGSATEDEGIASGAVSPGMNVNRTSASESMGRHTFAAGASPVGGTGIGAVAGPVYIVKEDALQGKTIDDAYANGDNLFIHKCIPGDHILVLVAAGQNVGKNDFGQAIASGLWTRQGTNVNATVQFLEGSGGLLATNKHLRAVVL